MVRIGVYYQCKILVKIKLNLRPLPPQGVVTVLGQELLEEQLLRIEIIKNNEEISETAIYNLLEQKKKLLLSSNADEKKQVLQEYIKRIILNPSRDINHFDVEITYRVFNVYRLQY